MATAHTMSGLTDTDILIDAARKLPQAIEFLTDQQEKDVLQISIISAMELVRGCRDKPQLTQVQQFVAALHVVPATEAVSHKAYQLMQMFHLSHGLLLPDALIGATCVEYGMRLFTRNVRHFEMIPGLTTAHPY